MLSYKLVKAALREVKQLPRHAYKVTTGRIKNGAYPYEKIAFGAHRHQYLCWFEPNLDSKKHIIIFYHGGGWTFGRPEIFRDRAKLFAEAGYQVVMPAHRKLPFYDFTAIREDLTLTLKQLFITMQTKRILHKKIIVGGVSSGGNLAALLFFDPSLLEGTGFKPDQFTSAFFCGAPVNLEGMTDSFLLRKYAGKKGSRRFSNASPINLLPNSFSKELLVIHGTEDGLVNYESTVSFVQKLKKISTTPIEFYTIPNGSHLESVSWAYENNPIRQKILAWINRQ